MAEKASGGGTIPWPAVLAVLAATGGAFFLFSPLQSGRPAEGGRPEAFTIGYQQVEARLWQDPFKAVKDLAQPDLTPDAIVKAFADALLWRSSTDKAPEFPAHTLEDIGKQIKQIKPVPLRRLLVLGVMVQANAYPELAEIRRRTRVAVLEGLGRCGFAPHDSEHIAYFRISWSDQQFKDPLTTDAAAIKNAAGPGKEASPRTLCVPYEWADPASVLMAGTPYPDALQTWSNVLVLWLDNGAFADIPLTRLATFIGAVRGTTGEFPAPVDYKIIGPFATPALRAMVVEARKKLSVNTKRSLVGVELYAASPTAEDGVLLVPPVPAASEPWLEAQAGVSGPTTEPAQKGWRSVVDLLEDAARLDERGQSLRVFRTTATDAQMCDALIDELELRGVHVRTKADGTFPDEVAIVAEWDTFYGRALPTSFALSACRLLPQARDAILAGEAYPSWLHPYVYLRGLDGQAPGEQAADARKADTEREKTQPRGGAFRFGAPAEPPEGTNAADYLRRLAEQLADEDRRLIRIGRPGLKAVGVLGTDVYDKLMVLRALRDRMPGTLFFTTQLDARFTLPAEWKAAHNLVIVSPFGFTLHPYYQASIPPFRASSQTAHFAATLAAMGLFAPVTHPTSLVNSDPKRGPALLAAYGSRGLAPEVSEPVADRSHPFADPAFVRFAFSGPPRRFEIGRSGAVELTPEDVSGKSLSPALTAADRQQVFQAAERKQAGRSGEPDDAVLLDYNDRYEGMRDAVGAGLSVSPLHSFQPASIHPLRYNLLSWWTSSSIGKIAGVVALLLIVAMWYVMGVRVATAVVPPSFAAARLGGAAFLKCLMIAPALVRHPFVTARRGRDRTLEGGMRVVGRAVTGTIVVLSAGRVVVVNGWTRLLAAGAPKPSSAQREPEPEQEEQLPRRRREGWTVARCWKPIGLLGRAALGSARLGGTAAVRSSIHLWKALRDPGPATRPGRRAVIVWWTRRQRTDRRRRPPETFSISLFLLIAVPVILAIVRVLASLDGPSGQPFMWFSGVSVWPTEAVRILTAALCVAFFIQARRDTRANDAKVRRRFHFRPPTRVTGSCWARTRAAFSAYEWPIYIPKDWTDERPAAPRSRAALSGCGVKRFDGWRVDAQCLWHAYLRSSAMPVRFWRMLVPWLAYIGIAFALLGLFGTPYSPARGPATHWWDLWIMALVVTCSTGLLFYVLDGAYFSYRFIEQLTKTETRWPPELCKTYFDGMLCDDLTEYLEVQLIAARTKVVGKYIYYPFFISVLLILCRNSFFADWDWPLGLLAILVLNLLMAVGGAWMLRMAAENARHDALRKIHNRRLRHVATNDSEWAQALDQIEQEVREERTGAFSILSQYPTLAALLVPSGGLGLWFVVEYLAKSTG